ncbi:MAG: class I SAM-dependent methyltransferase [Deltaproteobacteria bacterium]|nr:class I SAM-dependent methyltransferase [Deltaproteobacteria bacterium]
MSWKVGEEAMRNPHFDDDLLVWQDEYSGRYEPPSQGYTEEFDLKWALALEKKRYSDAPGVSLDDANIADLVHEWTGTHPEGRTTPVYRPTERPLDHRIEPDLIHAKKCIDIGCGSGRWTRVMQSIGAESVLSVDASESALESVSRFNGNTRRVNLMNLTKENADLEAAFDFALLWGVAMCTHDPKRAFENAASTIRTGGSIYVMVYTVGGLHHEPMTNLQRRIFHSLETVEERIHLVESVQNRRWNSAYPLKENLRNAVSNLRRQPKSSAVGVLDMLMPYYNWVVPYATVAQWMQNAGFDQVIHLNDEDPHPCAAHVLGLNRR